MQADFGVCAHAREGDRHAGADVQSRVVAMVGDVVQSHPADDIRTHLRLRRVVDDIHEKAERIREVLSSDWQLLPWLFVLRNVAYFQ